MLYYNMYMEDKKSLRQKIKKEREIIDITIVSKLITAKIRALDVYKKAQKIMLFYPMQYEINLLKLMEDKKNFYFPRVNGDDLLVCPADGEFKKSKYNIYEPCSNPINPEILDLIIVPALAVDKNNYRLGYGGGFYDRFLGKYTYIKTIAPIYSGFVFDLLPHNNFDIPIDIVVTEK